MFTPKKKAKLQIATSAAGTMTASALDEYDPFNMEKRNKVFEDFWQSQDKRPAFKYEDVFKEAPAKVLAPGITEAEVSFDIPPNILGYVEVFHVQSIGEDDWYVAIQLREVMQKIRTEKIVQNEASNKWRDFILANKNAGIGAKVVLTNELINSLVEYSEDVDTWGQKDYYASLNELFSKKKGDCDDYAVAKYFTLLALGVKPSQMRIVGLQINRPDLNGVIVRGRKWKRGDKPAYHMVLTFTAGTATWVLDIGSNEVYNQNDIGKIYIGGVTPRVSYNSESEFVLKPPSQVPKYYDELQRMLERR